MPLLSICWMFVFTGLCKKGAETCESLHIYDMTKMPLCQFIADYGECHNADCLFNHTLPDAVEEIPDCIWYAQGFCKYGPRCKNRHRKKAMCPDYLGQIYLTSAQFNPTTFTHAVHRRAVHSVSRQRSTLLFSFPPLFLFVLLQRDSASLVHCVRKVTRSVGFL